MFEAKLGYPVYEISHKYVETPSADQYAQHMHDCCELLLFVQGDAEYNVDGILYRPRPYDLLAIPKATYHCFIPKAPVPYENYVLDFHQALIPPQHAKKLFSHPWIINIKNDAEFCHFFRMLDVYHKTYEEEDFAVCAEALLRELLVFGSYRMENSVKVEPSRNPLVDSMIRLISEHIEEPIDADFLAREMMLSKSYLQNVFSQAMQIGLKQYIMQKKIFAAHNDLMSGMSSGAVCAKYGFSDYSVFFRMYKKTLGYSPRQAKQLGL
ncbi:MAG: helix-turn-helix domain-containing protein [Clostridia bacterium]|nr:helix-turn-helix domain-containing protein [Clostridia bacterium]